MSGLLNGADCSVNSNPLSNVLKREGVDNSVFRVSPLFSPPPIAGRVHRQQLAWKAMEPNRWSCDVTRGRPVTLGKNSRPSSRVGSAGEQENDSNRGTCCVGAWALLAQAPLGAAPVPNVGRSGAVSSLPPSREFCDDLGLWHRTSYSAPHGVYYHPPSCRLSV